MLESLQCPLPGDTANSVDSVPGVLRCSHSCLKWRVFKPVYDFIQPMHPVSRGRRDTSMILNPAGARERKGKNFMQQ